VTPARTRVLALGLALAAAPGLATERVAAQGAVATLAQKGELFCRPSLPHFCGNMHVSCAGRTPIETFAFTLKASATRATIEPASGAEGPAAPYADARVEWEPGGRSVILLPRSAAGYIKLLADGSYSFRHYVRQAGVMSIGRCD